MGTTKFQGMMFTSTERLTKEAFVERLSEPALIYARGLARDEYVKIKRAAGEEVRPAFWRDDDCIFLDGEVEEECLRLCSELSDKLELTVLDLAGDLTDEE